MQAIRKISPIQEENRGFHGRHGLRVAEKWQDNSINKINGLILLSGKKPDFKKALSL